MVQTRCR